MVKVFLVGIGGFIGASSRYLITIVMSRFISSTFPYGTLLCNIIGAFLIGIFMAISSTYSSTYNWMSDEVTLFLTTGILGGLTTFSTFSYETISLFETGKYVMASFNLFGSVILCLGFAAIGKWTVSLF